MVNSIDLHIQFADISPCGVSIEVAEPVNSKEYSLFVRSKDVDFTDKPESLVCIAALPSMRVGASLVCNAPVSLRFSQALDTISDIFRSWDPSLHKLAIKGMVPMCREHSSSNRVGAFFTGGVDSFYTLLKHREEITDLIFVHGLDVSLDNHELRSRVSEMLREIGVGFNKRVIELETNLRTFLDSYVGWAKLSHGTALAGMGHLLFPPFKCIYIPATHTYADAFPWGSHPILDPLWSTETLEFVHDGCESTRVGKIATISDSDIALRHLRVCPKNPYGVYNCGRCEKCLRTMISLRAVGALDRCRTFETKLSTKLISTIRVYEDNTRAFVEENLKALENRAELKEVYSALYAAANSPWHGVSIRMFFRIQIYQLVLFLRGYPRTYQCLRWLWKPLIYSTRLAQWATFRELRRSRSTHGKAQG